VPARGCLPPTPLRAAGDGYAGSCRTVAEAAGSLSERGCRRRTKRLDGRRNGFIPAPDKVSDRARSRRRCSGRAFAKIAEGLTKRLRSQVARKGAKLHLPPEIDVHSIRSKLHLSQEDSRRARAPGSNCPTHRGHRSEKSRLSSRAARRRRGRDRDGWSIEVRTIMPVTGTSSGFCAGPGDSLFRDVVVVALGASPAGSSPGGSRRLAASLVYEQARHHELSPVALPPPERCMGGPRQQL
jgi:hypothetical protein